MSSSHGKRCKIRKIEDWYGTLFIGKDEETFSYVCIEISPNDTCDGLNIKNIESPQNFFKNLDDKKVVWGKLLFEFSSSYAKNKQQEWVIKYGLEFLTKEELFDNTYKVLLALSLIKTFSGKLTKGIKFPDNPALGDTHKNSAGIWIYKYKGGGELDYNDGQPTLLGGNHKWTLLDKEIIECGINDMMILSREVTSYIYDGKIVFESCNVFSLIATEIVELYKKDKEFSLCSCGSYYVKKRRQYLNHCSLCGFPSKESNDRNNIYKKYKEYQRRRGNIIKLSKDNKKQKEEELNVFANKEITEYELYQRFDELFKISSQKTQIKIRK